MDNPDEHMPPGNSPDTEATGGTRSGRKRWTPEAGEEAAMVLRRLAVQPWLVTGRDDEVIAMVRRNLSAVRDALSRLGWVLVVERDLVRLRKSPPVRRDAWAANGSKPLEASWFFLLVAAAESMTPRVGLAQLVAGARAAAAEATLPVTNDMLERRAMVKALRMLDERGVVEQVDGEVDGFIEDENAPVLLAIHHSRLAHVISNFGTLDPSENPAAWLEQVEREPDPARRMRRRLIDDTLVHVVDLDEAEADWLSRRVRGDDGAPLAQAFGLSLERRTEGAALVVPDDAFRHPRELGPRHFPSAGTVPHAALLLCEYAATAGLLGSDADGPGIGWRGLAQTDVIGHLTALAAEHPDGKAGWRRELAENPPLLAEEVRGLLVELDLLRVRTRGDGSRTWWFSPATGRWASPTQAMPAGPSTDVGPRPQRPGRAPASSETLPFDFALTPPGAPRE
ncbi:TIGR02678 family protein [Myxococcus virescens]|uniref:TIGR02678 family protein n=1 Tax=Myxococcus virescens TaxID=83456 RepID=UPI001FC958A4|nr:TIGR02678 family protein [Myxococcus virescens]